LQTDNQVGVASVCRIIACILHNVKLTTVYFDHQPSACVGHDAWKSEGLPVPPSEVVAQGWTEVLLFFRVFLAQFHDSMTSALNAASAVLVIGRCSLPLHALLHPDHPALLGTMLSRPSLGRCSLQRKRFTSDGRLQLLRCSCPLSALLLRLVSVMDHSGRCMAQHDRHKLLARIMKRYFSAVAHRLWHTQRF
jgi:hypothetical protein